MEVQRLMEDMDRGREGETERQTRRCLPGRASGLSGQRMPRLRGTKAG